MSNGTGESHRSKRATRDPVDRTMTMFVMQDSRDPLESLCTATVKYFD